MRFAAGAIGVLALLLVCPVGASAQDSSTHPVPGLADSDTIKALKGLTVPQFEAEMRLFVQALGVNCGYCHVRGNFASDEKPTKIASRKMVEMVKALNTQFYPDFKPGPEQSTLGRVTCYMCHQGQTTPKADVSELPAFHRQ